MKPVILSFVLLVAVLLGFAWMNGRFGVGLTTTRTIGEKVLYFNPEITLEVGKEGSVDLMANYTGAPVAKFYVQFSYDPTILKIDGVDVNNSVFGNLVENSVDPQFGTVVLRAESRLALGTLDTGKQKLATIKMSGLKKGGTVISGSRRPEVTIWENGKLVEGDFQMQTFKVNVK